MKGEFYIQVDGVVSGSPVVADIFKEIFDVRELGSVPNKPLIYKPYVYDTFTILQKNNTSVFLNHLNFINTKIQFNIELKAVNSLAIFDIFVIGNLLNTRYILVIENPHIGIIISMENCSITLANQLLLAILYFREPNTIVMMNIERPSCCV